MSNNNNNRYGSTSAYNTGARTGVNKPTSNTVKMKSKEKQEEKDTPAGKDIKRLERRYKGFNWRAICDIYDDGYIRGCMECRQKERRREKKK